MESFNAAIMHLIQQRDSGIITHDEYRVQFKDLNTKLASLIKQHDAREITREEFRNQLDHFMLRKID